jgi:mRNA-degrading endonuclease RelE of RelBE toxin-antitoxin system
MEIIETPIFTRRVLSLLTDDEYHLLQVSLLIRPDQGEIIEGSGGLRKLRWPLCGRGKSRGARVIYYLAFRKETILMLFIYSKAEQDDLSPDQLKLLSRLVKEEFS